MSACRICWRVCFDCDLCVGADLEKLRAEYHDEIEAMRALCMEVEESQERVRRETAQLRENENAVKIQESKILTSSEQIEQKQAEFQAKGTSVDCIDHLTCILRSFAVLAVLEESKRIVQLCDKKRDMHEPA